MESINATSPNRRRGRLTVDVCLSNASHLFSAGATAAPNPVKTIAEGATQTGARAGRVASRGAERPQQVQQPTAGAPVTFISVLALHLACVGVLVQSF